MKGVVSKDHIHLHIEYPPKKNISDLVKRLKGRSSRRLQEEYPGLKKRYWGRHFWAIGYGAWSTGNITDKMVEEYLEHHRRPGGGSNKIILDGTVRNFVFRQIDEASFPYFNASKNPQLGIFQKCWNVSKLDIF